MILLIAALLTAQEPVSKDAKGRIVLTPPAIEDRCRNPWPPEWEEAFLDRAQHVYRAFTGVKWGGNVLEQEKDMYPKAMFGFVTGNRAAALEALQRPDVDARDHAHTLGVDLYWCFTLKGQVRKYHFFGPYLDPAYKARMLDAMKLWTEEEPLRRPHPVHGKGKGKAGEGWGPDTRGSWVDVRGTDNLRAMREVAVYLFAEEAGREETRKAYLDRLRDYVVHLYRHGMSEWDSENYHGHSLSTWHGLYDFAKDPEAKLLGKAALDWLYTAAALKFWRGGFGGPNARDYGNANVVFGSNVSHALWLYFGGSPQPDPTHDRDDIHHLSSSYRPPAAVVALAARDFPRPVTMTATKPWYNWAKPGPRFHETQHFGTTFQMGSVVSAEPEETWNVSPFKLMIENSQRGVDFFVANTVPLTGHAAKKAGDQVAQSGNRLSWRRPSPATFHFMAPKTAAMEVEEGIRYFRFEKTWVALKAVDGGEWTEVPPPPTKAIYAAERFWTATLTGFSLEVGEGLPYEEFKSVTKRAARFVAELNPVNDLPRVEGRDWAAEKDVYAGGPVTQAWESGTLRVEAGGRTFSCSVDPQGRVRFENR